MYIFVGDEFCVYGDEIVSFFYFEINNIVFPDIAWSDFVYPTLCDWTDILLNHQNSASARYTLYYLTGPYTINIYQDENKMLDIKFIRDCKCIHSTRISYIEFAQALCCALRKTRSLLYEMYERQSNEVAFARANKRTTDCIHELKKAINSICQ